MEKPTPALVESAMTFAEQALSEGLQPPIGAMSTLVDPPGFSLALLGAVKGHEPEVLSVYYQTALIQARCPLPPNPDHSHAGPDALVMITTYARQRRGPDEPSPTVEQLLGDPTGFWMYDIHWCSPDEHAVWSRKVTYQDDGTQGWDGDWMGWGTTALTIDNWIDTLLVETTRAEIPVFNAAVARETARLLRFPDVRAWKD